MSSANSFCPVCRKAGVKETPIEWEPPRNAATNGGTPFQACCDNECPARGCFVVVSDDRAQFLENERERSRFKPARLSALLREQTIGGLPSCWVQFKKDQSGRLRSVNLATIHVDELLARWPRTVPERIDRTLRNSACGASVTRCASTAADHGLLTTDH